MESMLSYGYFSVDNTLHLSVALEGMNQPTATFDRTSPPPPPPVNNA